MAQQKQKKSSPKKMRGKIVSTAMQKTVVVEVGRLVEHPLYRKRRVVSKKYKVHCEDDKYNIGDIVQLQETSPMSKHKRWVIISDKSKK